MGRMTDAQHAEARRLAGELYNFLHENGDEPDEFGDIWRALDSYASQHPFVTNKEAGDG